jgi:chromosome segregation ATPase
LDAYNQKFLDQMMGREYDTQDLKQKYNTDTLKELPPQLEQAKIQSEIQKEILSQNTMGELSKYTSKKGDFKGLLPEVTGEKNGGKFKNNGDRFTEGVYGDSTEQVRQKYQDYKDQKASVEQNSKNLNSDIKQFKSDVKSLPELPKRRKGFPNKQGGFINVEEIGKSFSELAKKYKSAEEFVKAQFDKNSILTTVNKKVYRGEGNGIGNSTLVNGKYFADSKEFASTFGNVSEDVIPKGTKVFNLDTVKNGDGIIPKEMLVNPEVLTKYLIDNGVEYTRNTNTRGVEYVKLNKVANELDILASKSKSLADFNQKVLDNWDKYREEIARISKDYNNADVSRLRSPMEDIYNRVSEKGLPQTKSQLTDIYNKAVGTKSKSLPKPKK